MTEEINWKSILDSLAQLIAEHGKKIKALKNDLLGTLRLLSLSIDTNIPNTIKMGVEKLIRKLEGR